jgi:hypothetical protein
MTTPAVNALLESVSGAAERLGVRALLSLWQRATRWQLAGKSL